MEKRMSQMKKSNKEDKTYSKDKSKQQGKSYDKQGMTKKKESFGKKETMNKKEFSGKKKTSDKKESFDKRDTNTQKESFRKKEMNNKKESFSKRESFGKSDLSNKKSSFAKNKRMDQENTSDKNKKVEKRNPNIICPIYHKCGGCQLQNLSYPEQLRFKQKKVEELIGKYGKVERILGMKDPLHYRNKIHSTFDRTKKGIISGVYEEGTHNVINVDTCYIQDQRADAIIRSIRDLLVSFKIKTYDEDTGYGLFRHVLIRTGYHSGEIMVVLVLGSPILPSKNNFVKALRKLHPEITTIVLNVNNKRTSMILGEKETVLYGKGYIEDTLCEKVFRISPKSFYQVNPTQTEYLYNKAIEYAGLTGKETVVDAYCGIGTIGIIASDRAKEVISVEQNADAVRDARTNAKRNNISNIQFFQNDAGQFMIGMAEQQVDVDVVFMDPPRAGSDEAFLSSVVRLEPKKVVYISCSPETLARDLEYLTKHGYQVKKMGAVDMFPFTTHVETVVLLSKGEIDSTKVKVEFPLDELDITSLRGKATYEQIKEYVQQQTGLKVSNLYISQIKRKCGLEVGENYNKPKSEDSRVPNCPPEKEQAIMDALKHFGLVK